MSREVHVRFWERPGVKVLRATRHSLHFGSVSMSGLPPTTTEWRTFEKGRNVPRPDIWLR